MSFQEMFLIESIMFWVIFGLYQPHYNLAFQWIQYVLLSLPQHSFVTDGSSVNKQLFGYVFNKWWFPNQLGGCRKLTAFLYEMSSLFCQDFGQGVASSSRCDLKSNLVAAGCAPSALESPTSKLQVIEDRPLSNKAAGATQDVTQIKPQKLNIILRPGRVYHL